MTLKWSKEKPTEPGWYWIKDNLGTEIVRIEEISGTLSIWYERDYEAYPVPNNAEWAGPIPEPE